MAQQLIGVGTAPNDGQGNPIRTAFIKCNNNFSELYARAQSAPPVTLIGTIGDFAGMYASDAEYFYYCFADYDGSSTIWAQVTQIGNVALSSISSGTSSVELVDINGNAAITVGGVANVAVFTTTGQLITGIISATGNITGDYLLGNGSQLTGLPATYANSNVAAYLLTNTGNIAAGNVNVTGNVIGGNIVTPGIISTSGNIASQGRISATGNIETAGYFVGTFVGNVTGNFVVPGANTQVIFNTNGNADATAGMTFDTNGPNLFTVLGTISSQGNVIAGNITTAGLITVTGNVSGGNITTAGLITATGNIQGGNLRTSGAITATGNVSGGNILVTDDVQVGGNVSATSHTGTSVSVTGNVTGGNFRTAGLITASGNIAGNYFIGNGSQLTGISATTNSIQNGNSNVTITSANSNVVVNVTGVSPMAVFANTGLLVYGIISVEGNVTGGNVLTGGLITATGNIAAGNVLTGGLITATGNVTGGNVLTGGLISSTGNVTGGNLSVDTGTITVGNIINSNSNGVGNIGSSSTYFDTVFAKATSAQYADLAENYMPDQTYNAGVVVIFGGNAEITICSEFADPRVAGVISANPAHLMNAGSDGIPVALRGRVKVNVTGPVTKGDGLVTDSMAGTARSIGLDRTWGQAVFAKSLETDLSPGLKVVEAVIL